MNRIKNNHNWFLASLCLRCEPVGSRKRSNGNSKAITWINTHLICAATPSKAYDKALVIGRDNAGRYRAACGPMNWRFVGIWELLPVYEDIADGAELYYTDYGLITSRVAARRCMSKHKVIAALQQNQRTSR